MFLLPRITTLNLPMCPIETLGGTKGGREVYAQWPRSDVRTLRAVTAGGVLPEHRATAVSCRCSSPGVGKQEAAVTQLAAGEGAAVA